MRQIKRKKSIHIDKTATRELSSKHKKTNKIYWNRKTNRKRCFKKKKQKRMFKTKEKNQKELLNVQTIKAGGKKLWE